jgi:hypothetical protein
MQAVLANMDHGLAFAQQPAAKEIDKNQIMIAGGDPSTDAAFEHGEGFGKHGRFTGFANDLQAAKSIIAGDEPLAEMSDHVGLRRFQNVERQDSFGRQHFNDGPIRLDGKTQARRLKGALLHPACEKACLLPRVSNGENEQSARDAPEGSGKSALRIIGGHRSAPISQPISLR